MLIGFVNLHITAISDSGRLRSGDFEHVLTENMSTHTQQGHFEHEIIRNVRFALGIEYH